MTQDPPLSPRSPDTGSPSQSSTKNRRSSSVNSNYAQAFRYHSPSGSAAGAASGSGSGSGAGTKGQQSTGDDSSPRALPARPLGPRSPSRSESLPVGSPSRQDRDRPGSSRTLYQTTLPVPSETENSILDTVMTDAPSSMPSFAGSADHTETATPDAPHAPWRPPEAVMEPDQERPPGYVPEVVEEHLDDDNPFFAVSPVRKGSFAEGSRASVSSWKAEVRPCADDDMDVDSPFGEKVERPQIGPGVMPRRFLQQVHSHDLFHVDLERIPGLAPRAPGSPKTSTKPIAAPASPNAPMHPETEVKPARLYTMDDVWAASPGEANHDEWYFCTVCWAWLRVTVGKGDLPEVDNMENWEAVVRASITDTGVYSDITSLDKIPENMALRRAEWSRWCDIQLSRMTAPSPKEHLHEFNRLLHPVRTERVERIVTDDPAFNAFPHIEMGLNEYEDLAAVRPADEGVLPPRLFVSCSSDLWFRVERTMTPGQLPGPLAHRFVDEKLSNPRLDVPGADNVVQAWEMISRLLGNALFTGQRGWVKLANPAFQKKVGMSEIVSLLLYHIGFACRQEEDSLRVGPFNPRNASDGHVAFSESDVKRMDRYMLRTWLEIQIYMERFKQVNELQSEDPSKQYVTIRPIEYTLWDFSSYRRMANGYSGDVHSALETLGTSKQDVSTTQLLAYEMQSACDEKHRAKYLSALEQVASQPVVGSEDLQFAVAAQRSLGHVTLDDVRSAYNRLGFTEDLVSALTVEPHEAPDDYILDLHKTATNEAKTQAERAEIARALVVVGRARGSETMIQLGETGGTLMSVDEAYAAFNCPVEAVDDGVVMQYEMAIADFPGKTDHYRKCLGIIADAPGKERPALKQYLLSGSLGPPPSARRDIPVGLQNIGNTCYLNSILQYLYSIKPLREAVMDFEQDGTESLTPVKPEVERSKRFVRQLRLLFVQLYECKDTAVRPDEELAYLAITRPEIDAIVEPAPDTVRAAPITLDTIPDVGDMPSPTSTRVGTPVFDTTSIAPTETDDVFVESPTASTATAQTTGRSVLGKRASQDRESSGSPSGDDRSRLKSEAMDEVDEAEPALFTSAAASDEFEMVARPEPEKSGSPSAVTDLADLRLRSEGPDGAEDGGDVKAEAEGASDSDDVSNGDAESDVMSRGMSGGVFLEAPKMGDADVPKYDPPSVPPPLPARPHRPVARRASTLASGLKFGLQQDSAEVLINVLSQLELAFDPPKVDGELGGEQRKNLISELFSCGYRQQLFVETGDGEVQGQTPVESVFVHPIIGVEEEGKDLYDCLGELYLRGSEIEYEGKKGYIMDLMERFPPLLYIQMRYDLATGRERKTNTHIPFGQTLSMDRFLSSADGVKREASMALTREMTRLRTTLHRLRDNKPLSIPETFRHAQNALEGLKDDDELEITADFLEALQIEGRALVDEIEQLQVKLVDTKRALDELWEGEGEYEYELVSVYMHRGKTSGAGHYWTYQAHLPDHADKFFKYNDELVTEVPASEVLEDRTGSDANPALLCYVRKGRGLVDTLHRAVLESSGEEEKEVMDLLG